MRQAAADDLARVGEIWHATLSSEDPTLPPMVRVPSLYFHELETGELWVLEVNGEVAAFASVVVRASLAFLADLFVDPRYQSRGLGQRLLRAVLPGNGRTVCTLSSDDRRALALYARAGLRPLWPQLQLQAGCASLGPLATGGIEIQEAEPADPELLRWDAELSGRLRQVDHAYWVRSRGGIPLWFTRLGNRIGYGYVQTNSDDLLHAPDTLTLGPLGTPTPQESAHCVLAAVEWARTRADRVRISLTGPHPAAEALLSGGFRITALETFCASADSPLPDPRRYIPSGSDLF